MTAAFFIAAFVALLLAVTIVLQGVLLHETRDDLHAERDQSRQLYVRNRELEGQLSTFAASFADHIEKDLHDGGGQS